jgi:monovalent cation:H+ antiporter-2, CPA2 family
VASAINLNAYSDALVVLGTAGILVPLLRKVRFNPVFAYLGAGALLGPHGLGSFVDKHPTLYWITITDANSVAGISELGIVFLLFQIGLELSFHRLMAMRRLVFGLGGLQIALTATVISAFVATLGQPNATAIIIGTCLSMSSTAVVLELLSNQGRLAANVGRASFSILLAQDLAVVPLLLFVSTLGNNSDASVLTSLANALIQAVIALAAIVLIGHLLLRPLFRLVAGTHSAELFIAAVLFVVIASGVVSQQAGLSMALGAFVSGLLLAETEYAKAIRTNIEPFKGLLIGIFFFTIGMKIDAREIVREPAGLFASIAGLLVVKFVILAALTRAFRFAWPAVIEASALLAPGGEFAFVTVGAAAALDLIGPQPATFIFTMTSITMALTPLLSLLARNALSIFRSQTAIDPELTVQPRVGNKHAIVIGYGRVGKVVCSLLRQHGVPFIATDLDPRMVTRDRREGHEVYFGDATDPQFLETCGLREASGVIVTIHSAKAIDKIVSHIRALKPDLLIVSRARDADHARHLYTIGATDAVPETIEASLQLSEAALVGLGVPTGAAIATIHEKRDEFRHILQGAAQIAGRDKTYAIRKKSRLK